jgi:uncharacterized protein
MRSVTSWAGPLLVLVVVLAVVTWLVRRVEPRLAFFPLAGEDVTPQTLGADHVADTITTDDGERLRVWRLPRTDAAAQVVYFHGNGGNLSLWADVLVGLWHQGLDVTAIDYRGYGLSTGSPSEQGLYRDVDATLRFFERLPPRTDVPTIYWGRSLGSVMAAYAASRRAPDGVVLEAGFPSMRSVLETNPVMWALSWVSSYRMPTAEWMSRVRQPTLVMHGDRDSVIPYRLGQRLYNSLPGPKTFVTIPGGDHNEAVPRDAQGYWRAVRTFVSDLRRAPLANP